MMLKPKGLLIDLDGTVYSKRVEIENSFEFILQLKEVGIAFRFLTNTTSKTSAEINGMLQSMGLTIPQQTILTPIQIADQFLKDNNIGSFLFIGADKIARQFTQKSVSTETPEYIILGDMQHCDYEQLNSIYHHLNRGAKLLTTSYSDFFISAFEKNIDTGAFTKLFEKLTREKALLLGKPSPLFYRLALNHINLEAADIVAVGDDIDTDIPGARSQHIFTVLVKTGKYDTRDLKQAAVKPDLVIDKLADLKKHLLPLKSQGC